MVWNGTSFRVSLGMEWNETTYRYEKTEWDGMGHMFVKSLGMEYLKNGTEAEITSHADLYRAGLQRPWRLRGELSRRGDTASPAAAAFANANIINIAAALTNPRDRG